MAPQIPSTSFSYENIGCTSPEGLNIYLLSRASSSSIGGTKRGRRTWPDGDRDSKYSTLRTLFIRAIASPEILPMMRLAICYIAYIGHTEGNKRLYLSFVTPRAIYTRRES